MARQQTLKENPRACMMKLLTIVIDTLPFWATVFIDVCNDWNRAPGASTLKRMTVVIIYTTQLAIPLVMASQQTLNENPRAWMMKLLATVIDTLPFSVTVFIDACHHWDRALGDSTLKLIIVVIIYIT